MGGPGGVARSNAAQEAAHGPQDGWLVAIDQHEDGTLVAEIDDRDEPSDRVPDWLDVVSDVTRDEAWTGGRLAR